MGYEDIGARIKKQRKSLDMSAADLAARLSMSKATIHRYENGDIQNIKMPVIMSMSRVLKCNPAWLLGKTDHKHRNDNGDSEERYMELANLFGDLRVYLDVRQDLQCNGKPLKEDDRRAIEAAFTVIWTMVSSKYE